MRVFGALFVAASASVSVCGQDFRITDVDVNREGKLTIVHPSAVNFYYVLYRGASPENIREPVVLASGKDGLGQLIDPQPLGRTSFYRARQVAKTASLEIDGDGLPDIYELDRTKYLDPLNPRDFEFDRQFQITP